MHWRNPVRLDKNIVGSPGSLVDPKSLNALKERLDNDHLKFNDFQNMIQSSHKRIESLFEQVKHMDLSVTQITMSDETNSTKLV